MVALQKSLLACEAGDSINPGRETKG